MSTSCRVAVRRTFTGSPDGESAQRVLEHVRERALHLDGVDAHRRQLVGRGDDDAVRPVELVERLRDELLGRPELGPRLGGARLEAGEVEKVLDEPLEPAVLGADRLEERGAVVVGQRELAALEAVESLLDRRERSPQVVRDRLDDGRLDDVAAPERVRLERLAGEGLALERDPEQRREAPEGTGAGSRAPAPRPRACTERRSRGPRR